ncbi:MAG: hypothetical protein ACYCOX_14800 [Acidobacteriaceae bacterium]
MRSARHASQTFHEPLEEVFLLVVIAVADAHAAGMTPDARGPEAPEGALRRPE